MDLGYVVHVFSPGDDSFACLNKAMAFLTVVASSRFPSTNNQLRTSSNSRNHTTIQDGRVTVQQVQGRQSQSYSGTGYKSNATSSGGNNASGQARTEDLDTYDSNCDDISNAKVVLMANISNYGSDVISERLLVYVRDTCLNVINLYAKKVVVTPKNKVKKVRLKCSTSNYGSKPSGNNKNDRISQTPSRNMKDKVKAQPRKVKKNILVFEHIRNVKAKYSLLNVNSICAACYPDCSLIYGLQMFETYGREPLTDHELFPVVVAPRAVDSADSLVSTSIDQDAPSTSILSTQEQEHSPNIS
uniref:Uncharacterized protein n=1 Tax=Tanacetum cinerariifolium TaxID=118510 RepID=A0A699GZH3_TANCI|nr:hypothetical protein [Tanacetum cinerariifolium]